MAHSKTDTASENQANAQESLKFQADGADKIQLPSGDFVADAAMTREGDDLILTTPSGESAVIEGYFTADPAPLLQSPDGAVLTPNLVEAFAKSPSEFAANETASDQSPVGAVEEVKGEATVTRADGTVEKITIGTPIYEGDVVETDASGAVNIVFMDETSMAVSENARLAIDEYTFDPATESGTTNFSVLRGLFVFTSGLIGRDDPDDVSIDTPVGSIGIRGTVIAGEINPGGESKITVLEGAIVVKNGLSDITLSEQFETVRLGGFDQPMENMGTVPASDIGTRFNSIGTVNPSLFTTINDAAGEQSNNNQQQNQQQQQNTESAQQTQEAPADTTPAVDNTIITLNDTAGLPTADSVTTQTTATNTTNTTAPTVDGGSGNTLLGPTTVPVPPTTTLAPPVTLSMVGGNFSDLSVAGTVVGFVRASGGGTYNYTFGNGSNVSESGHFELVSDANGVKVVLTTAGADTLGSSLDVTQLGGFGIRATEVGGTRTFNQSFSTQVYDSHNAVNSLTLHPGAEKATMITDGIANNVGYSITALGDMNGDGFDDFAFSNNTGAVGQNHSYIVDGRTGIIPSGPIFDPNPTTLSSPLDVVANPTSNGGNFAETVIAGIGDFDGDGTEDYIVGQQSNLIGAAASGNIGIVSGNTPLTNNLILNGSATAGEQIGASVDGAGDFNNDGRADVIVGAPGYGVSGEGAAYFIAGVNNTWSDISMSTVAAGRLAGSAGESFGSEVEGIGDFNGDGFSDFAVGAANANSFDGLVRIYNGQQSGVTNNITTLTGPSGGTQFGTEIVNLGDFNGDGRTDIMIGGDGANGRNIARMYMGYDAESASAPTSPTTIVNIASNYTLTGGNGVGDFNGDGYDDFVLTLGDADSTNAYVVFGKSTGITTIDLNYLKNPENAYEIRYAGANATHDVEVSGIGDVNGDGYDDFAMGVPDANGALVGNGGVAVVYGRNTGDVSLNVPIATANNQSLVMQNNYSNTMGDGGFDGTSMRGNAMANTFRVSNTNFLGIDGGGNATGTSDTILAQGSLNFSDVDFEKISGIEKIVFGGNSQTITLTMENIFNLLKSSDGGYLKIEKGGGWATSNLVLTDGNGTDNYGAAGNTQIEEVLETMSGGSASSTTDTTGPVDYNIFQIGGYKLYIDQAIAVDVQ